MAKFASPTKQAGSVMRALQGDTLRAVGTVRNYEQSLTRVAEWARSERLSGGLLSLTREQAISYLEFRGQEVGQKTLDLDRQALQAMFRLKGELKAAQRLPVVKSEHAQALKSRAYTPDQVSLVTKAQTQRNSLATEVSCAAGLRAHELLTLRPASERSPDVRPARTEKFMGRDGVLYTVQGKGGLIRHVMLPHDLSAQVERLRLDAPRRVTDRGVHYQQHYDLNGGHRWSSSFSSASRRALGWSAGAHGVRHGYAQQRMRELQHLGLKRSLALEIVSQEMGHFRPSITEVYLR